MMKRRLREGVEFCSSSAAAAAGGCESGDDEAIYRGDVGRITSAAR